MASLGIDGSEPLVLILCIYLLLLTTTYPTQSLGIVSKMSSLTTLAYVLAGLTAGGGTMGYVRTGSVPSVAAGCTVGALYFLSGYRIANGQNYGVELGVLASVVLAGSSVPRALRSGKPLPIGLSVLATIGLVRFGLAWQRREGRLV
ncbi:hypothetical protein K461DRAFT_290742 [Myriangium duriaei CBS 260.36]|uniref:Uncharacterized protein n=1 Tax=Myriangium duriaei CBS 260.36 TaxID=1168546 RepID=A0A9P4MN07_9PEZI|nr:hypothetical protein K461DRAFT_290742 [Myriangium duriaei CBS 260.36]